MDRLIYTEENHEVPVVIDTELGEAVLFSQKNPEKPGLNEDAAGVVRSAETLVLIVADGVGGGRGGGTAARLAVEAVAHEVSAVSSLEAQRDAILRGIEQASRDILALGIGAATTIAVLEIKSNTAQSYHVGDSEILITGQRGRIKQRTISHSPVGYLLEAGVLEPVDALVHEERNIVSNTVGSPDMSVAIGPRVTLAVRDTALLSTDGLLDNVHADEIVETIRSGRLAACAGLLAELTNSRIRGAVEGPSKADDVTFILFRPRPKR